MSAPANHARVSKSDQTLQDFLCDWLSISRNKAKDLLDRRLVFVNGVRTWMARHILQKGDLVGTHAAVPHQTPPRQSVPILFECNDYLVINKPAGYLSNGPDSVESAMQSQRREPVLRAAHRLDRETSGCLLMARSKAALEDIIPVFRGNLVVKQYHALVTGMIPGDERLIDKPIEGVPAVTHVRVLARSRHASHILARIETGRTHQIRKHLSAIGHPLLGDKQYGTRAQLKEEFQQVERHMLHASHLSLPAPHGGPRIAAEAPLPPDFRRWMKRLRIE